MIYHFDQSLIWHVVFHPGRSLWGRKYRHVSLAGYSDTNWLHIDLHRRAVSCAMIFRHDEVEDYLSYLLTHYTVLRFGPARPSKGVLLRPMSCVSFAKHTLGVQSGALRPDSLLRDLCRDPNVQVLNDALSPPRNTATSVPASSGPA
ncbi:MAG: hypothetical protein ACPG4X_16525 [Pikeienuella sp.]